MCVLIKIRCKNTFFQNVTEEKVYVNNLDSVLF